VEEPPVIRITVNGKRAYTVAMAADELHMPAPGLRRDLTREPDAPKPVAPLDARTPLYDARDIKAFGKKLGQRPGRGAPGKPRALPKRKPKEEGQP
jgi:hypothetical protein